MVSFWERPLLRLFAVFLLLGFFAWWTFQTVSLPPLPKDLFEEDKAVAAAATPLTEDQKRMALIAKLPPPPQRHAPEVLALLERLRNLPPVPYVVQAARQRDAAVREGETTPPWSAEERAAESRMGIAYREAWRPFLESRQIAWDQYPDSIRLLRSQIAQILDTPRDYRYSFMFLIFPDMNLYVPLRRLGALRFGTDLLLQKGWAGLDTVSLAAYGRSFFPDQAGLEDGLPRTSAPPPPQIEDVRMGLRSDRALFLSAVAYLEALPPDTPALPALERFLENREDAQWFMEKLPEIQTTDQLARQLRRDADQISALENRTFLSGSAWRQWLDGNPAAGLSPLLGDSLGGLRQFERIRLEYLVALALAEAAEKVAAGDTAGARRVADPAKAGSFLRLENSPEAVTVSSAFPQGEDPASRTSLKIPTTRN